jgi:hypothetical protein
MKRSELRDLIESGVNAITPALDYDSGRISEFNSNRNNEYPKVFFESIQEVPVDIVNQVLPINGWPVILHIGKKDAVDSSTEQYEQLIDECDLIAQKLIYQYNLNLSSSSKLSVTSYTRAPFVKKHADVITGVILSFTLNDPDQTSLC